uniref:MSP domain-containing protein n=1 Tax=Globodera pallida TaxID=36090 RepID=A0A183BTS0_GLOPA
MAQIPPEALIIMPAHRLFFNAPFDNKAAYCVRVTDQPRHKAHLVRINMTHRMRFVVSHRHVDHIILHWVNATNDRPWSFTWFRVDGHERRRPLAVEYNE